jgi:hypothetical protein
VLDWLSAMFDALLARLLVGSAPALASYGWLVAGGVLLAVAVLTAAVVLYLVRQRRRRPVGTADEAGLRPLAPAESRPARADIDARLSAGDAAGALKLMWRFVAAHLEDAGLARPAPDRTNRELYAEVRRAAPDWAKLPALERLTRGVDVLLYGGARLDPDAVRALLPLADELTT